MDLDRAVHAEEGLDAGGLLAVEKQRVLFVVLHRREIRDDAEEVGADERFDIPCALDSIVDKTEADRNAQENEDEDSAGGARDAVLVRRDLHGVGGGVEWVQRDHASYAMQIAPDKN